MSGNRYLPGFVERFVEVRGARIRAFEAGSGPTIALLHGLGGAASNWTLVAPTLSRRFRVLVPDLPGHGGSSALPAPVETLDPYADRVASLLPEPAVLVGHSLGAVVALRLAARRPDLVRGVVLAGAAGLATGTRRSERLIVLATRLQPAKRVSRFRRFVSSSPFLRTLVFRAIAVADPRAFAPLAADAFFAGSAQHTGAGDAGDALVRTDPRADLERLHCPALVLHGARDVQVRLRDGFEYARRLGAPVRTIADCGHLLIGERPHAVIDAIEDFLDRVVDVDELPLDGELVREPR